MKIPKKIRVGGLDYKIILEKKFEDNRMQDWGLQSYSEGTIKILTHWDGDKISDSTLLSTLTHELVHAIDFVYLGGDLKEHIVNRLGDLIFCLLADNDIDIKNGKLPKKFRVLGRNYTVIEDYEFGKECKETPAISYSTHETVLKCSEHSNREVLITNFLDCVLSVLSCDFFNENDYNSINFTAFGIGLYQVLKDSGLHRMIREVCKR